jgi:periplasmic divalent cation tolerance protein
MTDLVVILSTCDSEEEATTIAGQLVERGMAACVNVVPGVQSFYRWQGRLQSTREWLLLIKTTRELFPDLSQWLQLAHTYEVPEVVALPILDGSEQYLEWIRSSVIPRWTRPL